MKPTDLERAGAAFAQRAAIRAVVAARAVRLMRVTVARRHVPPAGLQTSRERAPRGPLADR